MAFENIQTSFKEGPSSMTRFLVMIMIAVILIAAVILPVMGEILNDSSTADATVDLNRNYTYTVTTSVSDVTISVSGDGAGYCTVAGNVITMNFKEAGMYTLEVTATSVNPSQTYTQTITIEAGHVTPAYYSLLWLVPTLLIVGLILIIIRGQRTSDEGDNKFYYSRYNEGSR